MPTLTRHDLDAKTKEQMSVHTLVCDVCGTLYSSGPHIAGSVLETEAIGRAERMQGFHIESKPGHRTRLYLDSHNILISTRVRADEAVRG